MLLSRSFPAYTRLTVNSPAKNNAAAYIAVSIAIGIGLLLPLAGCNRPVQTYRVLGGSMLPLLHPDDRIFVDGSDSVRSHLRDGDVVVLHHEDAVVIKRILALPGETIRGDQRKVFRDGKQLEEPYLAPPSAGEELKKLTTFLARTVAPGEIL